MEWNEFIDKSTIILKRFVKDLNIEYETEYIKYSIGDTVFVFSQEDYKKLYQEFKQYKSVDLEIFNDRKYEIIINSSNRIATRMTFSRLIERINNVSDNANGIEYGIQEISDVMVLNLIKKSDIDSLKRAIFYPSIVRGRLDIEKTDLFSILRLCLRSPISVCLTFEKNLDKSEISNYVNSFLFNLAYNYDYSYKVVTNIEEILNIRSTKIRFSKWGDFEDIDPPKLLYKEELTEHYHVGISSEDPFIQFIAFYHVMEYFYEEIYREGILDKVKNIIVNPSFSVKKKKELMRIVDLFKNKRLDSSIGSEKEALELTLVKYVDLVKVVEKLEEYDVNLVDYYKIEKVSFSKGKCVDLRKNINNDDKKSVFKNLANRIYVTRNALVHSKSNEILVKEKERGIYKPFKDSKELLKEIPLIRIIAEEIIIKTAKEL